MGPWAHQSLHGEQRFGAGPGIQFAGGTITGGIGFFPSLFGLQFVRCARGRWTRRRRANTATGGQQAFPSPTTDPNASPEEQHQAFLSKVLIVVAVMVLVILLFF